MGEGIVAIKSAKEHLAEIEEHGEETYPNECCGFLLGEMHDGYNVLKGTFRAQNEWPASTTSEPKLPASGKPESMRNRYLITPEQWKKAEAHAKETGQGIIGYYHSHPDHPAVPSGYDLDHSCWPGESYIIVSIREGKAVDLNSYTKPDYSKFEKEDIIVEG